MDDTSLNYLPLEIVEKILLDVPTYTLVFNKPWVCKSWTNILLHPDFWIRKLLKINIVIDNHIQSILDESDTNLQVACLYHACLYEEHVRLKTPTNINNFDLPRIYEDHPMHKGDYLSWDCVIRDDDEDTILMAAGLLVTRSPNNSDIKLHLEKERCHILPLLLKLISARELEIKVNDYYGFWNLSTRYDYLEMLKGPPGTDNIKFVSGFIPMHPDVMQYSYDMIMSIARDEASLNIEPDMPGADHTIRSIHMEAGSDYQKLTEFKNNIYRFAEQGQGPYSFLLVVSGLEPTHISWMTNVARIFRQKLSVLIFLSYSLNSESSEKLFKSMAEVGTEPKRVICASSTLDKDEANMLNDLGSKLWSSVFSYQSAGITWFELIESKN